MRCAVTAGDAYHEAVVQGPTDASGAFQRQPVRVVSNLADDLRTARGSRGAPCRLDLDADAWHAFLVYAEYGAANLRAVRALHP